MNLGELYFRTLFLIGKDQYGKFFPPEDFIQLVNQANLVTLPNKYIEVYEASRVISNNIRPFIKTLGDDQNPPLPLDNRGRAYLPDDYKYFSSGFTSDFTNECGSYTESIGSLEWLDDSTFVYRMSSLALFPTIEYPIATFRTKVLSGSTKCQIQVAPVVQSVSVNYLRRPSVAVFDYDIDGGVIIYLPPGTFHENDSVKPVGTPSASVELEWPEEAMNEIVELVVNDMARNVQDQLDIKLSGGNA